MRNRINNPILDTPFYKDSKENSRRHQLGPQHDDDDDNNYDNEGIIFKCLGLFNADVDSALPSLDLYLKKETISAC